MRRSARSALAMLADFDAFFDTFHGVFFDGDSWRFQHGDTLLGLYPDTFWVLAAGAALRSSSPRRWR